MCMSISILAQKWYPNERDTFESNVQFLIGRSFPDNEKLFTDNVYNFPFSTKLNLIYSLLWKQSNPYLKRSKSGLYNVYKEQTT